MSDDQQSYSQRVHQIIRQAAPPSTHGGVVALWRCNLCGRPWLADGPHAYLRLTADELAQAVERTHADLAALPYATCALCTAQSIGEIALDEYGRGMGYGLSWEGPPPTSPHLILTVALASFLNDAARQGRPPHAGIVTRPALCRTCLDWLAHVDTSAYLRHATPLTIAECETMAYTNAPALLASDAGRWRWHGVHWRGILPPLSAAAPTVMTVAQALPIGEPFSQTLMIHAMRAICATANEGHMEGENA